MADFETTTNPDDCRVWGYGIMDVFEHEIYGIGNDMDEFMGFLEDIKSDVYFHNLRFDGSFIVNWLYRNGYTYSQSPYPGSFNTTISTMNQWYKIQIVYDLDARGRPIHTTIFDSLKKLPFKVSEIAEMYNLSIRKGDIDYTADREPGHMITAEEEAYIYNDIHIMAQALKTNFMTGLHGMTIGSDALRDFKTGITNDQFKRMYPVLETSIDEDIRKAYRGGFTWLNPEHAGERIQGGVTYDVNSLYPYIMYDRHLPYGLPVYFDGEYEYDEEYPLFIQHIKLVFDIKDDHIPTIQIKKMGLFFKDTEYLESSDGVEVDLYVTNVDLKLIQDHYDCEYIVYESGWKFKQTHGIFKEYIDKWTKVKVQSSGGKKLQAKLMLNNLYGKFATNPDITGNIPIMDEEDKLEFVEGPEEMKDPVYTALGVFITSYARDYTIRTAQACYDRIIYCDTDSIHLTGYEVPDAIKDNIDANKLGFWGYEGSFTRGKYLRAKTYIQQGIINDKDEYIDHNVICAGMPDNIKELVTYDNFEIGFHAEGKLIPRQVPGGVVLESRHFTIK